MLFMGKKRYVVHTAGDTVLKGVSAPIMEITPEIRELAEYMIGAMDVFDGIGLAAPQAGKLLRLVVFNVPADSMGENPSPGELALLPRMPLAVVNPEIAAYSGALCERDEGCLSVPNIFAPVIRPETVVFQAATLDGERLRFECGGLLGRCIQHELDHLDGKLFTDRLTPAARKTIAADLEKLEHYGSRHHYHRIKVG